jgi:hypothetical protein
LTIGTGIGTVIVGVLIVPRPLVIPSAASWAALGSTPNTAANPSTASAIRVVASSI